MAFGPTTQTAYRAVVEVADSVRTALIKWLITVVVFSALILVGPLVVPWVHRSFSPDESLRNGELLGFAFALFAASAGRWIAGRRKEGRTLRWVSLAGMAVVALLSALIWRDGYLARVGHSGSPLISVHVGLYLSYAIAAGAFLTGIATEVQYAVTVQRSQVWVVP